MKKQALLCAAALTTVVVAGAAHAGTLTASATANATVSANRVIATEVALSDTNNHGIVGLALTPSDTAILPSGNSLLTVSLTGGATFGEAVTAGAVITGATCAPTTVVSTGGGAATSSVTFLVSNLGGCKTATPLLLEIPVKLNSATSAVNVVTNLTTEAGTAIDGGTATTFVAADGAVAAKNLISFAKAIDVKIKADEVATQALLAGKFTTLSADKVIGTAEIVVVPNVYKGIQSGAAVVAAGDVTAAKFTVKGDLKNLDVSVGGNKVSTAGVYTKSAGVIPGTYSVTVAEITPVAPATAPAIPGGAYTLAVDLTVNAALKTSTFGPSALETVTRQGTNYLLPWVASGTLSKTSTSNTVVRIANLGTDATGAVSVELVTHSGAAGTAGLITVAPSIAAKGEVILSSASLEAAFGADFGRGDIRVTVEGEPQNLSIRRFVQSTVTGALSEVSLGRSTTGVSPAN